MHTPTFSDNIIKSPALSHRNVYYLILHLLIIFIFFSKAGISICIGILFLLSLFRISNSHGIRIIPNRSFIRALHKNSQKWLYISMMLLFGLTVISGLHSDNTTSWLHFIKLKLPYLLMPIIFVNHPPIEKHIYRSLLLTLILSVFISSIGVMSYYALDMWKINEQISLGKSLMTPLTHVKFSVLLAMSIISAVALAIENKSIWSRHWRRPLYIVSAFLFVTIHILSARTGLLSLYVVGVPMLLGYLGMRRYYKSIVVVSLLALSAPFIAYYNIPSFYNKYHYMKHDLQMIREQKGDNYSDGERLRSILIGLKLWREHPLFGTGIGDLRDLCDQEYRQHYPQSTKQILPHNQYVMYLAGYGIIGLLIFMICLCCPITLTLLRQNPHFMSLFFILLLYGLVEKPFDEYVFIVIHSFFFCLAFSLSATTSIDKWRSG